MLISPAYAQAAAPAAGGDMFMSLMPLILVFVIFYFLLIRPQQTKMKQHREMLENLKKGDQIVTAGGIVGIASLWVNQRRKQIGVRRALGARRRTILMQFHVESALVPMIGGSRGTALGAVASAVIGKVSPIGAELSTTAIVGAIVFSAIVGLAFGTWPASRAARLDPIESLRFE